MDDITLDELRSDMDAFVARVKAAGEAVTVTHNGWEFRFHYIPELELARTVQSIAADLERGEILPPSYPLRITWRKFIADPVSALTLIQAAGSGYITSFGGLRPLCRVEATRAS